MMKKDEHGRVILPVLRKLDFFKMQQVLEPDFPTEQVKRYSSSTGFSRIMSVLFPIGLAAYLYFAIEDNNKRSDVETIKFVQTSTSKDASEWEKSFEVQCKAPICLLLHSYSARMIEDAGIQCIEKFGGKEHLILTEGQTTTITPCYVRGGMNEGIIFAAAYPPSKFASLTNGAKVKLPGYRLNWDDDGDWLVRDIDFTNVTDNGKSIISAEGGRFQKLVMQLVERKDETESPAKTSMLWSDSVGGSATNTIDDISSDETTTGCKIEKSVDYPTIQCGGTPPSQIFANKYYPPDHTQNAYVMGLEMFVASSTYYNVKVESGKLGILALLGQIGGYAGLMSTVFAILCAIVFYGCIWKRKKKELDGDEMTEMEDVSGQTHN
eukprot:TRINITY_DN10324_c0_g1_i1.p1 TRINITY_DN10324_c0_g1~~TRINITY_DN10324_c0_g1_i1.p1  ORF type:complete len:380 (-),score=122.47 TRINITY_DN10324_c0_g1_i1:126-1265(-)